MVVNIRTPADAAAAASRLGPPDRVLVDEMIVMASRILVGVIVDVDFGLTLVLGAGGVMTELLRLWSLCHPSALSQCSRRCAGCAFFDCWRIPRNRRDVPALIDAIMAISRYAEDQLHALAELDVNPIIVRPLGAGVVAVDALIRLGKGN